MAKHVAPPRSTEGGGFVFEDKVCSWFLAHVLVDEPPFDSGTGLLERIDFQTRPDGWFLDDLLLTLSGSDGTHGPCGVRRVPKAAALASGPAERAGP